MARSHTKRHGTRPAAVFDCEKTDDHPGHRWRFSEEWPEGVFWWCRGYDREEAREGVIATERAIRQSKKYDKASRARAKRARKQMASRG